VVLGRKKANGQSPDLLRVRDRNSPIRPAMSRCRCHAKTCMQIQAAGQRASRCPAPSDPKKWPPRLTKKKPV